MNQPIDPNLATGDGIFGLNHTPEDASVVLIPVPWDVTTSYRAGAARGPAAILKASHQIDLLDRDMGRPYEQGIALLPIPEEFVELNREAREMALPVIEALGPGDNKDLLARCDAVDEFCERVNDYVRDTARQWLNQGKTVGVIGGDHAVPFGLMQALGERTEFGVLHIDAHADLRKSYEGFRWSHASIFFNVLYAIPAVTRLVQVGIRDYCDAEFDIIKANPGRVHTFFDADLRHELHGGTPWRSLSDKILEALPHKVYVSFDVDGLDPTLCPNTGTPVPGGLSFTEAVTLLRELRASGKEVIGFDLCEVSPGDSALSPNEEEKVDSWDAMVGMRMLYKLIGCLTS